MIVTPQAVVAFLGVAGASYTDLKDGKIPNALTVSLMVLGLLIHGTAIDASSGGFTFALYGLLVALAIHFALFALGIERAGDAKLFMGIGALLGVGEVVEATCWYAVLYLPIGLIQLAIKGRLGNLVATVKYAWMSARQLDPGEKPEPTMLRTAPIIACAALGAWATDWFDIL